MALRQTHTVSLFHTHMQFQAHSVDNLFCSAGNDLLEYSPYEPVNSRLSDIFRLAPIIAGKRLFFLTS